MKFKVAMCIIIHLFEVEKSKKENRIACFFVAKEIFYHNPQLKLLLQLVTCFTEVNSSRPQRPNSLPNPLLFTPPQGA